MLIGYDHPIKKCPSCTVFPVHYLGSHYASNLVPKGYFGKGLLRLFLGLVCNGFRRVNFNLEYVLSVVHKKEVAPLQSLETDRCIYISSVAFLVRVSDLPVPTGRPGLFFCAAATGDAAPTSGAATGTGGPTSEASTGAGATTSDIPTSLGIPESDMLRQKREDQYETTLAWHKISR